MRQRITLGVTLDKCLGPSGPTGPLGPSLGPPWPCLGHLARRPPVAPHGPSGPSMPPAERVLLLGPFDGLVGRA